MRYVLFNPFIVSILFVLHYLLIYVWLFIQRQHIMHISFLTIFLLSLFNVFILVFSFPTISVWILCFSSTNMIIYCFPDISNSYYLYPAIGCTYIAISKILVCRCGAATAFLFFDDMNWYYLCEWIV